MDELTDWHQYDCFPIVYDIIHDLAKTDWVTHEKIVDILLNNTELPTLIYTDINRDILSNIVAWFSEKITEYEEGILSNKSKIFDLIENAHHTLDRKTEGITYSYKVRVEKIETPRISQIVMYACRKCNKVYTYQEYLRHKLYIPS